MANNCLAREASLEYQEVRYKLAETLEDMFLFPVVGKEYADALRQNNELDLASSHQVFADQATQLLQNIFPDGHLAVILSQDSNVDHRQRRTPPPAIQQAEKLTDDIAYLKLLHHPGDEKTLQKLADFIASVRGVETLIIDVRKNFGGGLLEIDLLFSALYDTETPLLYMDLRTKAEEQGFSSLEQTPQLTINKSPPAGIVRRIHSALPSESPALANTKVFVLTSNKTPSAAEHLTLALKRTARAAVIGETTAGLGHFGETIVLGHGFEVFTPIGATIDPDTGKGWEGVGVLPDHKVASSEALALALELAGVSGKTAERIQNKRSEFD
ncbi:MAG: S41 family peptidase [Pseudomonadota bacterium]